MKCLRCESDVLEEKDRTFSFEIGMMTIFIKIPVSVCAYCDTINLSETEKDLLMMELREKLNLV